VIFQLIIASLAVMAASLVGVVTFWHQAGEYIESKITYLVSFASGVFIVFAYGLIEEVVIHNPAPMKGIIWILVGLIGVWLITKILPHGHEHPDHERGKGGSGHTLDPRRMIIGDTFHNITDGILLAVAFIASTSLGIVAAISVFIHELVQEMAEFFILRGSGYSVSRALKVNLATSSSILIGAIGSYFLLDAFTSLEIPILGIATGAIIITLLQDLIPHSISDGRTNHCLHKHFLAVALGVIAMLAVTSLVSIH